MPDSMLGGLRHVSDEALFQRLLLLRQRFPAELPAEDYVYRCDIWEMANKAVRAEIQRRKAIPPPWWPQQSRQAPRRSRLGVTVVYLATVAGATVLFGPLALAAMAAVSAAGARIWWVARAAAPKDHRPPQREVPLQREVPPQAGR